MWWDYHGSVRVIDYMTSFLWCKWDSSLLTILLISLLPFPNLAFHFLKLQYALLWRYWSTKCDSTNPGIESMVVNANEPFLCQFRRHSCHPSLCYQRTLLYPSLDSSYGLPHYEGSWCQIQWLWDLFKAKSMGSLSLLLLLIITITDSNNPLYWSDILHNSFFSLLD